MSVAAKLEGLRQIWYFDNRWQLLLSRLLFRRERLLIYRRGELEILVDHSAGDPNGPPQLLTKGMYSDHFSHLSQLGALRVFDLGANTGGFPLLLHHAGFNLEQLVCVELNPQTCVRLRFNLNRNLRIPAVVVNAAVCDAPRQIKAKLGGGSVADSIYADSFNSDGADVVVTGRTFDDLYAEHFGDQTVDVCKMDVEKAEYEIFAAAGHDCLRRCRFAFIEVHDVVGKQPAQIVAAMNGLGFVLLPPGSDPTVYVFKNQRL